MNAGFARISKVSYVVIDFSQSLWRSMILIVIRGFVGIWGGGSDQVALFKGKLMKL